MLAEGSLARQGTCDGRELRCRMTDAAARCAVEYALNRGSSLRVQASAFGMRGSMELKSRTLSNSCGELPARIYIVSQPAVI